MQLDFFWSHNHPSEDLTPSEQDIQVTKKYLVSVNVWEYDF